MKLILSIILLFIQLLTESSLTQYANISVEVKNVTTGEVVDEYRKDNVVPPASVMKLLTTGAALETLGPSFRFTTTLAYSGEVRDGVLQGNLYISGGCDPSLGSANSGFLNNWVRAIQSAGIREIRGGVVADMTMLDAEAHNAAWLCEDAGNYYAPGVFAINYLSNTLNIYLKSGAVGSIAEVLRTEPAIPELVFNNHVRCTPTNSDGAYVHGIPYSTERFLYGSVPSDKGQFGIRGDIPNPGLLLAQHLTAKLQAAGVAVQQPATYVVEGSIPACQMVYEHRSDSLGALLVETNYNSNNLYAESLFRYMGLRYGQPGTINNAANALRDFWMSHGVPLRGAVIKDGCGLAPQDVVSAESFVELLTRMYSSRYREAWIASLPVAGQTGTVKNFLRGTELEGRVYLKSGTISGTKNFAGYIMMPNGDVWAFAVLVNGANCKARQIQPLIEKYLLSVYQANK